MTIQRMEHVGIVVDDLAAATAFFVELGLKVQGEGPGAGPAFGNVPRARPTARDIRLRTPISRSPAFISVGVWET